MVLFNKEKTPIHQSNYFAIPQESGIPLRKTIARLRKKLLASFDLPIEFIKGKNNSLQEFLTREFLHGKHELTTD